MAKFCSNCEEKIGFLDPDLKFNDKKYLCQKCLKKYGFTKDDKHDTPTNKAIDWALAWPYSNFIELKESGQNFRELLAKAQQDLAPTDFKSASSNSEVQKAAQKINKLAIPKEIKKQLINAQVFDFWFNNKELKSLPNIIDYQDGEIIKYVASGYKDEDNESRTVLIICTNRRVIFLNKNMFFGGDSTDIPLNMINSVQLKTHLVLADIAITNGSMTTKLSSLSKLSAPILAKTIKNESLAFQQKLLHPTSTENNSIDAADHIRKFKQLADDGIITQEEFEAKKKQLLGV